MTRRKRHLIGATKARDSTRCVLVVFGSMQNAIAASLMAVAELMALFFAQAKRRGSQPRFLLMRGGLVGQLRHAFLANAPRECILEAAIFVCHSAGRLD